MDAAEAFRVQSAACAELGSPMYADLADRCADDIAAGGPVADVLVGHEDDPGPSALALRLLGSVHRLVLERRAGELAAYYPSVGGRWESRPGWIAFRELSGAEPELVRQWLDRSPQTNEVGRAAALYGGLLHLDRDQPLRLCEIGSSAGLNLRADLYCYRDRDGQVFGDPQSPVQIDDAWSGRRVEPWPELWIEERVGSDPRPIDMGSTAGRLALTAYVWPDQRHRLERLRHAFSVAERHPVELRPVDARQFVDQLQLREGVTTVLMHSVMWQYLSRAHQEHVRARVHDLGSAATAASRFAHLRFEPQRRRSDGRREFLVPLTTWPGCEERVLGNAHPHGVPTTWA